MQVLQEPREVGCTIGDVDFLSRGLGNKTGQGTIAKMEDDLFHRFILLPDDTGDRQTQDPTTENCEWLGGDKQVQALEEVVGLGAYGRTLTVLTCPSVEDQVYGYDDDDEEERLIKSWTPQFRR